MRVAAMTAPPVDVLRSDPDAIDERARVVVVALVVVAFTPVKFWKVEEARAREPPVSVVTPPTARVPVRLAVELMV